ncbi:MAG: hypothetical protein ISR99_01395 [Parcubacteria group bacterium]|nr:hypothetical protein [Parcubacteria group bacterium]
MFSKLRKFSLLESALSGLFVGIPFVFPLLWPLVFVGFPLYINRIRKLTSSTHALLNGWIFGAVFIATYSIPLFDTYPLPDFWGVSQYRGLLYIAIVWALTSIVLGVIPAIWSLVVKNIRNTTTFLLIAPLLWVISEYLRALLLSFYLIGENTELGADFSFGFIGYTVTNTQLLLLAKFGGVYMLSFAIVALSAYISLILKERLLAYSKSTILLTVLAVYTLATFILPQPISITINPEEPIVIKELSVFPVPTTSTLGQETIEGKTLRTETIFSKILDVVSYTEDPILFVLPENSDFINRLALLPTEKQTLFQSQLKDRDITIVDSSPEISEWKTIYKNTIRFWTPEGGIVSIGYKEGIVPFGEYMPVIYKKLFSLLSSVPESSIESKRPHIPEKDLMAEHTMGDIKISALSCSEIYNPSSYKNLAKDNADILVNVASYAMFNADKKEGLLIWPEIMAMAKTHAMWAGKPYVQASNDAPAFVIVPRF